MLRNSFNTEVFPDNWDTDDENACQRHRHSSHLAEVSGYEIEANWADQNATKESDIAHQGWAHDEADDKNKNNQTKSSLRAGSCLKPSQ